MTVLNFDEDLYTQKVNLVTKGFSMIETLMEGFALGLTKQLNETHSQNMQMERDRDELSKSLQ
jgi:hypothetical protein